MFIISFRKKARGNSDATKIWVTKKDIQDLKTRKTEKLESPTWLFAKKEHGDKNPSDVGGFVIDWDKQEEPNLDKQYEHYTHQTHGKCWRIIVPFDKYYKFTNAHDWISAYYEMLNCLFRNYDKSVQTLIKEKYIDKKVISPNMFVFMRPVENSLLFNAGERYKPTFRSKSAAEIKKGIILNIGTPRVITDLQEGNAVLKRMSAFYDYYKNDLDWTWLAQKRIDGCIFGGTIHDKSMEDVYYNNPTDSHVASIVCMHTQCKPRLQECLRLYQNEKHEVTNYTVLHLTWGIMQGIYSIEQIEACGFWRYKGVLERLENLKYLKFNPKIDCASWIKMIHTSIVYDPTSSRIYTYEDGYYKYQNNETLRALYHDAIGTYVGYRTGKKTRPYIEDMLEFARGSMLTKYETLVVEPGLSLENGVLMIKEDGDYEFHPCSPSYFYTHKMAYEYDESADCPIWKRCMIDYFESLNSPQVLSLQEFAAYCLTNDRRFEKLMIMYGNSRSGKNTIVRTLKSLMPSVSLELSQVCNEKERVQMVDKKIVFIDEATSETRSGTKSQLKKISSTDSIQIRPMRENAFETHIVPKLILAFNKLPKSIEMDPALKDRIVGLKFTRRFMPHTGRDPDLWNKLQRELPGILNWVLEGYKRLMKNRKFTEWEEDTEELYQIANEDDPSIFLEPFIETAFKEKPQWGASDLYEYYLNTNDGSSITRYTFGMIIAGVQNVKKRRTTKGFVYEKV